MMGGIATDLHGRASVQGLYAVGECSCTGLHGANRLASNSLTECFVFGRRAAAAALSEPRSETGLQEATGGSGPPPPLTEDSRAALWQYAGLERDGDGLRTLAGDAHPLVRLIATSALARAESRGAHQRRDYPERDPELDNRHVTMVADQPPTLAEWR
jgi:L-aspartate oxidase